MTVKVGYITRWRRAIFLSVVVSIVLFGFGSTLGGMILGKGIQANMLNVLMLMGCIILVLLVVADKWDWFEGEGTADVSNGRFEVIDTTRPYGYVDSSAKIWFQTFEDDGVPHEYLREYSSQDFSL